MQTNQASNKESLDVSEALFALKGIYNSEKLLNPNLPEFKPKVTDTRVLCCVLCWYQPETAEDLDKHLESEHVWPNPSSGGSE